MVQIFYIEWVTVTREDGNTVVMLFDPLLVSTVQEHMRAYTLPCQCKFDHLVNILRPTIRVFFLYPLICF